MAESNIMMKRFTGILDQHFEHVQIMCYEQERIHRGYFFSYVANTTSLANSSYVLLQINTPTSAVCQVNLNEIFVNNSGGLFEILAIQKPTTFVSGTTPVTFINRNFNSTIATCFTAFSDPTGLCLSSTITSTQCDTKTYMYFNSTGTNQSIGNVSITAAREYILKYNTTYVIKLTNLSGNDCYNSIRYYLFLH